MNEGEIREYIEKNLKNGYSLTQIEQALKDSLTESEYKSILNEYQSQEVPDDTSEIAKGKKTTLVIIMILQFLFALAMTITMFLGPENSFVKMLELNVSGPYLIYLGLLAAVNLLFSAFAIFYIIEEKKTGYSMAYLISLFAIISNPKIVTIIIQGLLLWLIGSIRKEKFKSNKIGFTGTENLPNLILIIWMVIQLIATYAITFYFIVKLF